MVAGFVVSKGMQYRVALANLPQFLGSLDAHARQVRYALAVALTRTAKFVQAEESAETQRVFKAPVPWTINSPYTKPATKQNLSAEVGIKDDAAKGTPAKKYLQAEIFGGARRQKRSERALATAFPGLGNGYWVPGPGVTLNAYGNVPGPTMVSILADVRAFGEVGYLANRTKRSVKRNPGYRGARYFVPPPGSPLDKRARGVWMRKGGKVMPALVWVKTAAYRSRFDFYGLGERTTRARFPIEFEAALDMAFATAWAPVRQAA